MERQKTVPERPLVSQVDFVTDVKGEHDVNEYRSDSEEKMKHYSMRAKNEVSRKISPPGPLGCCGVGLIAAWSQLLH